MTALAHLLAEGFDPGWSLELRARCRVQQGELAKARDDLERLLEVDIHMGWESTVRRAIAHAALGDPVTARQELEHIASGALSAGTHGKPRLLQCSWRATTCPRREPSPKSAWDTAANIREDTDRTGYLASQPGIARRPERDYAGELALLEELSSLHRPERQPALGDDVAAEIARAEEQHVADRQEARPASHYPR